MSLLECGDPAAAGPLLKRGHVRALQIPVAQLYCGGRYGGTENPKGLLPIEYDERPSERRSALMSGGEAPVNVPSDPPLPLRRGED